MGQYSQMIEKQQKFIDKLTGNQKYQGEFGEKFLEQILNFAGFKLGIDYTKQKKKKFTIQKRINLKRQNQTSV